MVWNLSIHHQD